LLSSLLLKPCTVQTQSLKNQAGLVVHNYLVAG
jgi:hypothetical protein